MKLQRNEAEGVTSARPNARLKQGPPLSPTLPPVLLLRFPSQDIPRSNPTLQLACERPVIKNPYLCKFFLTGHVGYTQDTRRIHVGYTQDTRKIHVGYKQDKEQKTEGIIMYHQGKHQNVTAEILNIVAIQKTYSTRCKKNMQASLIFLARLHYLCLRKYKNL